MGRYLRYAIWEYGLCGLCAHRCSVHESPNYEFETRDMCKCLHNVQRCVTVYYGNNLPANCSLLGTKNAIILSIVSREYRGNEISFQYRM